MAEKAQNVQKGSQTVGFNLGRGCLIIGGLGCLWWRIFK